jgi:hypothetical protein
MVVEVVYAAVATACFGLGWCATRHSCREHTRRHEVEQQPPQVVTARRVRPELPAR